MTARRGVIVAEAWFRGLKLRMAVRILLEIAGRLRMRIARQLRVASMRMGSLCLISDEQR
jgi:hypothetical protein